MHDNEVDKLVEEMYQCMDAPSKVILDIIDYEKLHQTAVLKKFPKYPLHFEHAFALLVEWTKMVNYLSKKNWPDHRVTQFILIKNNMGSLYSAFDRLLKGFYSDATILLRTSYEAFIRTLYISYFPQDQYIACSPVTIKNKKSFNLTGFVKNTLKVNWDFIYRLSSSYAHSHNYETLKEIISLSQNGQKSIICFKLQYDEKNFSVPVNYTYFLLWGYLKIFILLFIDPNDKKVKQDFYNKLIVTEKAFGAMIRTMPNKWAITFNDLEKIITFIRTKENITY